MIILRLISKQILLSVSGGRMCMMLLVNLCFKISLIAFIFWHLTDPEMIFAWYGKLISRLPNWLYYPLGGCLKCFTGQVCFWYFIFFIHPYNLIDHLFFTSSGIFLSLIYEWLWTHLET